MILPRLHSISYVGLRKKVRISADGWISLDAEIELQAAGVCLEADGTVEGVAVGGNLFFLELFHFRVSADCGERKALVA